MGQIKVVVHQDAEIFRKDFSLENSQIHFTVKTGVWPLSYLLDSTNIEDYSQESSLIWNIL